MSVYRKSHNKAHAQKILTALKIKIVSPGNEWKGGKLKKIKQWVINLEMVLVYAASCNWVNERFYFTNKLFSVVWLGAVTSKLLLYAKSLI